MDFEEYKELVLSQHFAVHASKKARTLLPHLLHVYLDSVFTFVNTREETTSEQVPLGANVL